MGRTSNKPNTRFVAKPARSKGRAATNAMRSKLDRTIKRLDEDFELCKTIIVRNLRDHEIVEGKMRRVMLAWDDACRIFGRQQKELDIDCTDLAYLRSTRDMAREELREIEEDVSDADSDEIDHLVEEIADRDSQIEEIEEHVSETERNMRIVKTIFKDVERCLQTRKDAQEINHSRLCRKLAVIGRFRQSAIAQREKLVSSKNGKREI